MRTLIVALFLSSACGGSSSSLQTDASPVADASHAADATRADAAADPRGPAVYTLAGGANGLLWDDASSTLYLTNNDADTLIKWTDAGGLETVGMLPAGTAGISLGDLVKQADGSILTTSFGFGTQGTLFQMPSTGASVALTGLDATRRRIGLSQDSNGVLYEGYFVGGGGGMQTGGVSSVVITDGAAVETEIAGGTTQAGFKKVVGLVATPTAVFVADQTNLMIYQVAVPGFAVTTLAAVPAADLMSPMPNGDLLIGGTGVHRVTQAGVVTALFTDLGAVRGTAYDPTLRRLFIIEHSATAGVPDKLHVRPLDN